MIEGLKVSVSGVELRQLCTSRAEHHRQRATVYAEQKASMQANQIEGMNYTGGDPTQALQERLDKHLAEADEMEFISRHLSDNEWYTLGRDDLCRLGIAKSRF